MSPHTLLQPIKTLCSTCSLHQLCLPIGLKQEEFERLDSAVKQSTRIKKGEFLFRTGETFNALYAVRTGFFKTILSSQDGRDQVTGFFMSGELLGMEGICNKVHSCDAVALEDSEVCELPFHHIEDLTKTIPGIQTHFLKLLSQEIVRDQNLMLLLGNMRAEERLAAFLINLSERLKHRGFASNDFILRMSREEIGSYLGLKLETVSRTLSKFHHDGLIVVENKHIRLVKPQELKKLVSGCIHTAA